MKTIIIDPTVFDGASFAIEYSLQVGDFWIENENVLNFPVTLPDVPNIMPLLSILKDKKNKEIDKRTAEIIAEGFTYDLIQFSMSEVAQINWVGMSHSDLKGLITYPFAISTKANGEYLLTNKAALDAFFTAGLGMKISVLAGGRALKLLVNAAIDKAGIDAIVDTR